MTNLDVLYPLWLSAEGFLVNERVTGEFSVTPAEEIEEALVRKVDPHYPSWSDDPVVISIRVYERNGIQHKYDIALSELNAGEISTKDGTVKMLYKDNRMLIITPLFIDPSLSQALAQSGMNQ